MATPVRSTESTKTHRRSVSTPVTSARITVVLRCFLRIPRIGEAICPGLRTDVATWYSRGWKRWWFWRSMRITSAWAEPSALAAARPPKPPPTITTRGSASDMAAHDHRPGGGQLHDQPEHGEQERQRSGHPHDDPGQRLIVEGRIAAVDQAVGERQDRGEGHALEHGQGQVRDHRPARPRRLGRAGEDHGAPEQQRAHEETRVLDVVPEVGVEGEVVESRHVPDPEADGERRPADGRMDQPPLKVA